MTTKSGKIIGTQQCTIYDFDKMNARTIRSGGRKRREKKTLSELLKSKKQPREILKTSHEEFVKYFQKELDTALFSLSPEEFIEWCNSPTEYLSTPPRDR
jgi:hypothetical protein